MARALRCDRSRRHRPSWCGTDIQIRGRNSIGLDNSPLLYIDGVRVNNATTAGPVAAAADSAARRRRSRPPERHQPRRHREHRDHQGPRRGDDLRHRSGERRHPDHHEEGRRQQAAAGAAGRAGFDLLSRCRGPRPDELLPRTPAAPSSRGTACRRRQTAATPIYKTGQTRSTTGRSPAAARPCSYYRVDELRERPRRRAEQLAAAVHVHANLTRPARRRSSTSRRASTTSTLTNHLGADFGARRCSARRSVTPLLFPAARGFFPNSPPDDSADAVRQRAGCPPLHRQRRPSSIVRSLVHAARSSSASTTRATTTVARAIRAAARSRRSCRHRRAAGRIAQTLRHNIVLTADYTATATVQPDVGDLVRELGRRTVLSHGAQLELPRRHRASRRRRGDRAPRRDPLESHAGSQTLNTTIGAYGQQQFVWSDRLFLTAALRVDNNCAFGEKLKWVTYPKVSGSWVVSEEPFWQHDAS